MILLRCTIETTDPSARETCTHSLDSLRKHLRSARDTSNWDLADIFLNQCDEPISRVIAKLSTSASSSTTLPNPTSPHPLQHQDQVFNTQAINVEDVVLQPLLQQHGDFGFDLAGFGATALTGDLGFSFEGLGLPFENLWSGFDGNQDGDVDGGNGMDGF
jgi:hypothetical protein